MNPDIYPVIGKKRGSDGLHRVFVAGDREKDDPLSIEERRGKDNVSPSMRPMKTLWSALASITDQGQSYSRAGLHVGFRAESGRSAKNDAAAAFLSTRKCGHYKPNVTKT